MNIQEARELLKEHGQSQLLEYYDELTEEEQRQLLDQLSHINYSAFHNLQPGSQRKIGTLTPVPAVTAAEAEAKKEQFTAYGLAAIRAGKVAAVLLAGGQGTRLGSNGPKGAYNIGITRELSIFGQQFANIRQVTDMAGVYFHIFVMTSELNDAATREFFRKNNYFGYPEDKIHFFIQDMAVSCDTHGKILLAAKGKVAASPNGNGGWYASLIKNGYGDILKAEGIEWLNVYAVDNVLQRICDPVFIGATILSGSNCGAKVVKKVSPDEKVGVLCLEDGLPAIVEYYEIPQEIAALRRTDGELRFPYGVILNYLFKTELLNLTLEKQLPVHLSFKKIPYMHEGKLVEPDRPNGYKFEYLVLDMIKLMGTCLAVEVVREREFAPIKNKTGIDSVESARKLLEENGVKL